MRECNLLIFAFDFDFSLTLLGRVCSWDNCPVGMQMLIFNFSLAFFLWPFLYVFDDEVHLQFLHHTFGKITA